MVQFVSTRLLVPTTSMPSFHRCSTTVRNVRDNLADVQLEAADGSSAQDGQNFLCLGPKSTQEGVGFPQTRFPATKLC